MVIIRNYIGREIVMLFRQWIDPEANPPFETLDLKRFQIKTISDVLNEKLKTIIILNLGLIPEKKNSKIGQIWKDSKLKWP